MTAHEQETRQWLQYARRDLTSANTLVAAGDSSNACYLSQQTAEKALKAIYVFSQIQYPYRHDLDVLRDGLPSGWPVSRDHSDLSGLTAWAAEARYPTELPDATENDARTAIAIAQAVYDSVMQNLVAHGFTP